jgi:mannose-1-phosphate guanylyltransferase
MALERVTITIKSDTLKRIDKMVDGRDVKSRSHAIEQLIMKSMAHIDTALILAGSTKKALADINGTPLVKRQIDMLRANGVEDIYLAVSSDFPRNFDAVYIVEKTPLGTAGSIKLLEAKSTFAVLNGDTLVSPDIREMAEFHKTQGALATVLLVAEKDPSTFGAVRMRGNRVLEFIEKPKTNEARLVNAGFYLLEPEIIKMIPNGRSMLETLMEKLAKEEKLGGFVHDGPAFDIGTAEGLKKAVKQ